MERSPRSPWRSLRPTVLAATAVCLALAGQPLASSAATPDYRADITPGAVAAGTKETLTVTLTHLDSTSREMGSVRITAPDDIELLGASARRGSNDLSVAVVSGSVTVGNLQLNDDRETATVTIHADIPCGVAVEQTWEVEALKNQSFDDGGVPLVQHLDSDLTNQVARCSLEFATQPRAAAVDAVITSEAANPEGIPIRVQLRNGNGGIASQAGVDISLAISSGTGDPDALHGDTSASTDSGGLAELFGPRISRSGYDYRLVASASGITRSDDSAAFDITDVAVDCSLVDCSGTSDSGNTKATVSAETNGILSFSLGGPDGLDCDNSVNRFYQSSSKVLTFDVTGDGERTTVTITLAASSVTKVAKKYEVCFNSPESNFTNTYGVAIAAGEAGLLPGCPRKLSGAPPCVLSKERARNGDIVVKFSVPVGDPRGKI